MDELYESFVIDDDDKADWALTKIAEELAERDRLVEIAQHKIEDLQSQIKDISDKYDTKTNYLKSCLALYFTTVPHRSTKTQETYKLLSGSLVMKKPSQKILHDDDLLISYLKENDSTEYIKTTEKVDWVELKKHLQIVDDKVIDTDLGIEVSACTVEEVAPVFNIKF